MHGTRVVAAAATALLAVTMLSGCGMIQLLLHQTFPEQFGPFRGDDGQVSADTDASVKYLQLDDCFDFPDEPDESRVTLKPCTEDHTFRVIATGTIGIEQQQTLGLQLAITQECQKPFDDWSATMPADKRKDYKSLVRDADDGTLVEVYTCIAALQKLD